MAGTVTADLTLISTCDALTGWTAVGGTNTLNDPTVFDQRQGSYCIQNYSASAVDRGSDFDFGADKDFSNTVIYSWFAFSKVPHATNPMRIRVTDAAGNWREWNIFTKATLPHLSWLAWALHTTVAYDGQSATAPTMTAIRKAGWRMTAVVAKVYIYFDVWRYGTGLSIKGGTSTPGDEAKFEDFYSADNDSANAYGIIEKYNEIYFVQGQLKIGSTTAGESTYFKDVNKVLTFKGVKVAVDFYDIKLQGNATATTKVYLGTKSGSVGISGCVFRSAGAPKYKFTATDANITDLGIYGCSFFDADTTSLPVYSATREVLNTNFEACAMVLLSTCTVQNCNFISADDAGARVTDTSDPPYFKNSNLISCPYGVRIPNAGTYKFDNLKFSGSTSADIDNTSGGLVTVNCVNGANPTTYTGNTVINNYVDVTVTVKDEAQANIQGASVRVSKLDDNAVVYMNELTDVNGVATESINYPGAVNLRIRARKSSTGTRYIPLETTGLMTTTGFTLTVTLYADGNIL